MFLSQQSAGWTKLTERIRRASEIRNHKRVLALSHEVFGLWERTVARVIDTGLIGNAMGSARTAGVMWASINGAFMLLGDDNFFRDITGLDPEHFIHEALESHLIKGAARSAPPFEKIAIENGEESQAIAARSSS